jgi:hypothetical protein
MTFFIGGKNESDVQEALGHHNNNRTRGHCIRFRGGVYRQYT